MLVQHAPLPPPGPARPAPPNTTSCLERNDGPPRLKHGTADVVHTFRRCIHAVLKGGGGGGGGGRRRRRRLYYKNIHYYIDGPFLFPLSSVLL